MSFGSSSPPGLCDFQVLKKPSHFVSESPQLSGHRTVSRVDVISWDRIDHSDRLRWQSLRQSQPTMATPFFSTAFIDAVHAARGDVLVAIMEDSESVLGYLPFHLLGQSAKPVGRFMNDAHNVIATPQTKIPWPWLLRQIGTRSFDFHAMVGSTQHLDSQMIFGSTPSFSASIGEDGHAYLARLEKEHRTIQKQDQKTRKMIRRWGPLRFEFDCRDPGLLEQTIRWKREQYRRTNILDLFTPDWTRRMLRHLHDQTESARGLHSVLWAGDRVVAAHIGMIENDLLHYWFPTYNTEYSIYSPGTALFKTIVAQSTSHGIRVIDMGYGEQPYKKKQTDAITSVSHGCITGSRWLTLSRQAQGRISGWIKRLPMKQSLKCILRQIKPDAGIGKLA
jgi:CelD/BcsL family acetyltransferase involved in cellulose biosynthesis